MNNTETKVSRLLAMRMAMSVRNHLEWCHFKKMSLTDDNMPEINRQIRAGIYEFLKLMEYQNNNPKEKDIFNFLNPPDYWEEDMFDKIDKRYWGEDIRKKAIRLEDVKDFN